MELEVNRDTIRRVVDENFLPSVNLYCMLDIAEIRKIVKVRHQKLYMLARAQLRPLRAVQKAVKIIGDVQGSPKLMVDLLAHGPKLPVRDKFTRMHSLAYADKLLVDLNDADP